MKDFHKNVTCTFNFPIIIGLTLQDQILYTELLLCRNALKNMNHFIKKYIEFKSQPKNT